MIPSNISTFGLIVILRPYDFFRYEETREGRRTLCGFWRRGSGSFQNGGVWTRAGRRVGLYGLTIPARGVHGSRSPNIDKMVHAGPTWLETWFYYGRMPANNVSPLPAADLDLQVSGTAEQLRLAAGGRGGQQKARNLQ